MSRGNFADTQSADFRIPLFSFQTLSYKDSGTCTLQRYTILHKRAKSLTDIFIRLQP